MTLLILDTEYGEIVRYWPFSMLVCSIQYKVDCPSIMLNM